MREYEHRKQKNGEVRHEDEFVLVDGDAFLVTVEKAGIELVK